MKMKKMRKISAVFALAILSMPLAAAERAANYEDAVARAKAGGKDIVVFQHGSDWNRLGEKLLTNVWMKAEFAKAVGDVVLVAIDRPDTVSGAEAEALKAKNAKFTWRGDDVPRIALLDREGRAVTSEDKPRADLTAATMAARVRELQQKRVRRDALWDAAGKEKGAARAELLRQSLDLLGLGNSTGHEKAYKFVQDQIKEADPGDESGAQRWLQFSADPRGVPKCVNDALKLVGEKQYEDALAALDRELADPHNRVLDHDRVQRIMLGRFQVYRQWPGYEEKRFDELKKIAALDATTYHGIGATGYLNMHFRTPTPEFLYYGWGAAQVKAGKNAWTLKASNADYLDHAGAYVLHIKHQSGKDTVKIRRVCLRDGNTILHESSPNADLAPKGEVAIPLTVKTWNAKRKAVLQLELEAAEGKTDCGGRFEFEPLLPETASAAKKGANAGL